jgi:hypothetical protein
MVDLGAVSKRNRVDRGTVSEDCDNEVIETGRRDMATIAVPAPNTGRPRLNAEQKRFCEAVEKAENSTLIFNLNLGRVPIMNVETMSTRATLALAAMAAETEKQPGAMPTEDTVATIDDILSMSRDIEFFGKKNQNLH